MAVRIEKLEIVGVLVHDVAKARELFSRLFGIEFLETVLGPETPIENVPVKTGTVYEDVVTVQSRPTRMAIDTNGFFELLESHKDSSADGFRNMHFKVPDIDEAIAEMQNEGIRLVGNIRIGNMREAIFDTQDLFGCRICFVQYDTPTMIEALLADTSSRDAE